MSKIFRSVSVLRFLIAFTGESRSAWNTECNYRSSFRYSGFFPAALLGLLLVAHGASGQQISSWSSTPTSADWGTGGNWTTGIAPGATNGTTTNMDTAVFNSTSTTDGPLPGLNLNVQNITFDTSSADAYTIGNAYGNAILLTNGGTIQSTSSVISVETVNAPLQLQGNGGSYTFANYSSTAGTGAAFLNIGGGVSGVATLSNTTTLTLGGSNVGGTTGSGGFQEGYNASTISGVVADGAAGGRLALAKTDAGVWRLTNANTYSGGTSINSGIIEVTNPSAFGTATINIAAGGQAAFDFSGGTVPNNIVLNGLTTNIVNGYNNALLGDNQGGGGGNNFTGTVTLAGSMNNVGSSWIDKYTLLSGRVTGSGGLQIDNYQPGTTNPSWVRISNPANDFAGGIIVNSGKLQTDTADVIPYGAGKGDVTINAGATLNLSGNSQNVNGLWGGGAVSASTGTPVLTVGNNDASSTFSGVLQDGGTGTIALSLTKVGSGTLTLTGNGGYSGLTTVNGGTLQTSAGNSLTGAIGSSNSVVVNSGATVSVGGDNSFLGSSTSGSKTIQINAGGAIVNSGSSTNHLNALVLNGGTLSAATANATYGNWNFDFGVSTPGSGLTSKISGGNAALTQAGGTVFNIGSGDTVNVSTALAHTTAGDTGLIKSGGGALVLTNANNYTGGTTISAGTLQLGDGTSSHDGSVVGNILNNAALVYNLNGSQTYVGAIAGTGSLIKAGTGMLTLSNNSTYSGPTVISGGTIRLLGSGGISMQWSTTNQFAITSGTAGAVGLANWNFSDSLNGTLSNVADSNNNVVPGTSIMWTAQGGPYTNGGLSDSNIHKLLSGGLESQSTQVGNSYITVSGIPYSSYNVYVYVSGWSPSRTGNVEINQNATGYISGDQVGFEAFQTSSQDSLTTYTAPTTGNPLLTDILFSNVSGSSLRIDWQKSSDNMMVSAIQIVNTVTDNVLPTATPVQLGAASGPATLDLNGVNQQIVSLSDNGSYINGLVTNSSTNQPVTLTVSSTDSSSRTTFSGTIQDGAGGVKLVLSGSGTLVLAGNNTFTGGTDVQGGTLILGSPGAIQDGTSLTVGADALTIFGSSVGGGQATAAAVSPVPEPSTLLLLLAGLVGFCLWRKTKGTRG